MKTRTIPIKNFDFILLQQATIVIMTWCRILLRSESVSTRVMLSGRMRDVKQQARTQADFSTLLYRSSA